MHRLCLPFYLACSSDSNSLSGRAVGNAKSAKRAGRPKRSSQDVARANKPYGADDTDSLFGLKQLGATKYRFPIFVAMVLAMAIPHPRIFEVYPYSYDAQYTKHAISASDTWNTALRPASQPYPTQQYL